MDAVGSKFDEDAFQAAVTKAGIEEEEALARGRTLRSEDGGGRTPLTVLSSSSVGLSRFRSTPLFLRV